MYVILSDLHLGDGGPLEDFLVWGDQLAGPPPPERPRATAALDTLFGAFLGHASQFARERGFRPTLILSGDTFDLWQAQQQRETVRIALQRILYAHPAWVTATRSWIAGGGEIVILAGNHDHALFDRAAWSLLREVLPGVNNRVAGVPAHSFCDEACGLYVEHGHRWDPVNCIKPGTGPRANPPGRRIVRTIVNSLEPRMPWIDKGTGIGDLLRVLRRWPVPGHDDFKKLLDKFSTDTTARQVRAMNNGIRRALSAKVTSAGGPMPSVLRFFVSGHTHEPLRLETRHGVTQLNPGTWRPVLRFGEPGPINIDQRLHYIVLRPDQSRWTATLDTWPNQ